MTANLSLVSRLAQDEAHEPAAPIGIVLADHFDLTRRHLGVVLAHERHIEVVAEAADLASAMHEVEIRRPAVLVLDSSMPGERTLETVSRLCERASGTRIVLLTLHDSPVLARRALSSGVFGCVLKEHADSELPEAIRAAASGEKFISPRIEERSRTGLARAL